jgi:hypothetical protein
VLGLIILRDIDTDISLEVNAKRAKCMIVSRRPKSGENQNIKISYESFENVAELKYLKMN